MNKIVAYYRAFQPSATNLDVEAQRQSVRNYAHDVQSEITAEFTEHTGAKNDTPELVKAIDA